jgi:hypothetical protein
VSEWKSIHITTHDAFVALNIPSKRFIRPVTELADWYVHSKLGVPKDVDINHFSISRIYRAACAFVPDLSSEQNYREVLEKHLPPSLLSGVLSDINKSLQNRIEEAMQRAYEVQALAGPMAALTILPAGAAGASIVATKPSPKASKSARNYNGEDIIQCSKDFKAEASKRNLPKADLLCLLEAAVAEILQQKNEGKILLDPLKTWAYRASKVIDCLQSCHHGNKDAFLMANSGFTVSRFACSDGREHKGTLQNEGRT